MKRITKNMCGIILGVTLCFAAIACGHDTDFISGNSDTVITTSVTESTTSTSETTKPHRQQWKRQQLHSQPIQLQL